MVNLGLHFSIARMLDGLVWEKWCFIDCLLGSSSETKSDLYLDIKAAGTLKCLGIQITTATFLQRSQATQHVPFFCLSQILIITKHSISWIFFRLGCSTLTNSCLWLHYRGGGLACCSMMAWKMNVVPWMSLCLMVPFLIDSKTFSLSQAQGWTRIMRQGQKRAF